MSLIIPFTHDGKMKSKLPIQSNNERVSKVVPLTELAEVIRDKKIQVLTNLQWISSLKTLIHMKSKTRKKTINKINQQPFTKSQKT